MQYTLVGTDEGSNISVFIPGQAPLVAHSSHPNFDAILKGAVEGDDNIAPLFDVTVQLAEKFNKLSDRVSVAFGRLFFDGDEVDNALATQAVRLYESGSEDYKPLVNFYEKVQTNASEHSKEQLYTWLDTRDFTITADGLIVGYKGVRPDGEGFRSINSGKAIVNGEVKSGQIFQKIGDVVEMPRSEVQFDPAVGCSTGLHVGTWDYASSFAQGVVLEVHVDPRDIVSVPTECDWQKMRVCRYTVVGETKVAYTDPVLYDDYEDDDYDEWGDHDFYGEDEDDDYLNDPDDSVGDDLSDEDFDTWDDLGRPVLYNGRPDVEAIANERAKLTSLVRTPPVTLRPTPAPYHGDPGDEQVETQREPSNPMKNLRGELVDPPIPPVPTIGVGDRFEDTDIRRAGNVFKVESVDAENGVATGKWEHSGLTRTISIERLLSRKYRQVF